MIHKLKILPEFFPLVEKGKKRFELRKNDRNYQEDDILLLQEYFDSEYTGRQCVVKITNVFGRNYYLRPVRHFINQENQCTY